MPGEHPMPQGRRGQERAEGLSAASLPSHEEHHQHSTSDFAALSESLSSRTFSLLPTKRKLFSMFNLNFLG